MAILKKILVALLVFAVIVGGFLWWVSRGNPAELSLEETTGVEPVLAEPNAERFPTVEIAQPIGWGADGKPTAAPGLTVNRFAEGLEHPRVLYAMPNGDILVTLTNAPPRNVTGGWLQNLVAKWLFDRAGAGVESPNQLVLLRDADGDGVAEGRHILRDDLDSPSGIAWADGKLYIANHDEIIRFDYEPGSLELKGKPEQLSDLPAAGNHWMRNIIINPEGDKLFVAVGSASNIGEGGMEIEQARAAIHEIELDTLRPRLFADGLRNANGMDFSPWSGDLWTTVNERDMLGSDLVPDYLTDVPAGSHYGWPWVYYNNVVDERVEAPMPEFLTEYTRTPRYALGAHVAPLGMVFTKEGSRMGSAFGPGVFVARHGSWNRKPAAGYDVVFVKFDKRGNPVGKPLPVLESFLTGKGETYGRPTWLAWDQTGALLVSDDTANIIWRVIAPDAKPAGAIKRLEGEGLPPRRTLDGDPARAPADLMPGNS